MHQFERTEAGTAAVTNPRIFLPTRLRALLAALDGRADPLGHGLGTMRPEEVRLMLETLCKVGYVRQVSGPDATGAANDSQPAPLHSVPSGTVDVTVAPVPPRPARPASPTSTQPATAPSSDPRDVMARMSDFLMTHLGGDALPVLFALEGLTTADQLRAGLPAYAESIEHLGAPAREHLAEIRAALNRAPSPTPVSNH